MHWKIPSLKLYIISENSPWKQAFCPKRMLLVLSLAHHFPSKSFGKFIFGLFLGPITPSIQLAARPTLYSIFFKGDLLVSGIFPLAFSPKAPSADLRADPMNPWTRHFCCHLARPGILEEQVGQVQKWMDIPQFSVLRPWKHTCLRWFLLSTAVDDHETTISENILNFLSNHLKQI